MEQIGLQLCNFVAFDSAVFENFFENDDKLFSLIYTAYVPALDIFLHDFCAKLEEANKQTSLKPNDNGRELIMETWRKRGMKFHADYVKEHSIKIYMEILKTDPLF